MRYLQIIRSYHDNGVFLFHTITARNVQGPRSEDVQKKVYGSRSKMRQNDGERGEDLKEIN